MSNTEQKSQEEEVVDLRQFRRVDVHLQAAVILAREEAYTATTVDVSEGGIMLDHYSGPKLRKGRLVGVNLSGVVSDAGGSDSERFLMRVVRNDGEVIALRFTEEVASTESG